VTNYTTPVSDTITLSHRRPSRGRSVMLVAFLFGVSGRTALPGSGLGRLLQDLGVSPDAGRALLSRMRRNGQLVSIRHGRGVEYRLAGDFAHAFARVRDQTMARPTEWTGCFHALLYQVPERYRSFRDELRRSAVLCGYGILQQGVLIAPTDRSAQLSQLLARRPDGAQVWLTTLGMAPAEAARAAYVAWDLADLARLYHSHTERLSGRLASLTTGSAAGCRDGPDARQVVQPLRDFVEMLAPALTDTLREPGLPATLLPEDWPGPDLRKVLNQFTATFGPATQGYLESLLQ